MAESIIVLSTANYNYEGLCQIYIERKYHKYIHYPYPWINLALA